MVTEIDSGVQEARTRIEKREKSDPQKNYRKQAHWEWEKAYPEIVRTRSRLHGDVWMCLRWMFGRHHKNFGTVRQNVLAAKVVTSRRSIVGVLRDLVEDGWLQTEWNGKGKALTYILDGEMKVGVGQKASTERKGCEVGFTGKGCEAGVTGVRSRVHPGCEAGFTRSESLKKTLKETLSKKDDEAEEEAEKTVSIEEKEPEIWAPGRSWDGLVWYEAPGEGPRLVPWREHPEAAGEDLRACEEGLREGREWEKGWGPARAARCFRIEKEIEEKYR